MNDKQNQIDNLEPDPQFDAMLDKACSPDNLPPNLVDNILGATTPHLPNTQPSVIARITTSPWIRAAAVIAFVATIAIVTLNRNQTPSTDTAKIDPPTATPTLAEAVQSHVDAVEQYATLEAPIDSELDLLEMDITLASYDGLWDETSDPFNDTITQWN